MKLIDADSLLEQMKHRKEYVGRMSDPVCLVEDAPEAIPKCSDCVFWHFDRPNIGRCGRWDNWVTKDEYCSRYFSK